MSIPRSIIVHEQKEGDDEYLITSHNVKEAMSGVAHHQRRTVQERPLDGEFVEKAETALAVPDAAPLALLREPELVVAEGRKAAQALLSVIGGKPRKVVLNGKQYLEVDDWTLLGQFYGASAMTAWTRPVTIETAMGKARGWEARVEVIDTRTGLVLSAGEAMCTDDEENWGTRTKYQWMTRREAIDKGYEIVATGKNEGWVRAKAGEEEVPDGSRRSMAQTRATSRALAMRLRWIPVLAGLSGTPAEEMPQYRREAAETPGPTAVAQPISETDKEIIRHAFAWHESVLTDKRAKPATKEAAQQVLTTLAAFMKEHGYAKWSEFWQRGGRDAHEVMTVLGVEPPSPKTSVDADLPLDPDKVPVQP